MGRRLVRLLVGLVLMSSVLLPFSSQATVSQSVFRQTYMASGTFTPAATPTDLITVTGSATKTVRLVSLKLYTTNTAAGSQQVFLVKRSTVDTTGTFVAATSVPVDSANNAATATVGHYTANPGALGTAVGTLHTLRISSPAAVPGAFVGGNSDIGVELLPINMLLFTDSVSTLRGITEQLVVNFAGAALVIGQTHAYTIIWTEE